MDSFEIAKKTLNSAFLLKGKTFDLEELNFLATFFVNVAKMKNKKNINQTIIFMINQWANDKLQMAYFKDGILPKDIA